MKNQNYILLHKKYIDYRINKIIYYVTLKNNAELIKIIIEHLISDQYQPHNKMLDYFPEETALFINELKTLIKTWDILNNGDIVGYIYQEMESKTDRKIKGQYFTPDDIVSYITIKSLNLLKNNTIKILDPSCGSGQFLISVFKNLLDTHSEISPESAAKHIIKNNIFGFDIDPVAVQIAKFNLKKISGCNDNEINIFNKDFLYKDELYLDETLQKIKFDLIIGNPPWVSKFTIDEKQYFKSTYASIKSGINTCTLFLERSFDFLKEKGVIAFLIPEAYLNIKAHRDSRNFVLNNAEIKDIAIWGEKFKNVFAPSISLIMRNEYTNQVRTKNIIQINPNTKNDRGTSILIPQASYYSTPENIFNINYSRKAVNIISIIENQNCLYLKDRAKFFLGIVTGNNSKFISKNKSDKFPDPIIVGRDVSQYKINYSSHYFKFNKDNLQQVAPHNLYQTKNKILYKFIGKKLTFALDTYGYYSLNNVNGFIPSYDAINIETTLSLLNSYVIQYFYEKNFFTVKVLRGNLERLPLKLIDKQVQSKIKKLTLNLIESSSSQEIIRENIEDIIFYEYGIKDKEAFIINNNVSRIKN